jgi:hypothetical protein
MNANEALALILKGLEPTMKELQLRAKAQGEGTAELVSAEGALLRLRLAEDRAALELRKEDGSFQRLSLSLLELDAAAERDCQYIASDFAEALEKQFQVRRAPAAGSAKKPPKSVSKTAIKNGEAYYDALSFVNSFTGIYQELRGAFKENYETYGEFLPEEFFLRQGGNDAVLATIQRNDETQMKRLFGLLNDVYENGVNDVQSLITVTILGVLHNDEQLLANCVDYMSRDLAPVVIRVNKLLASPAGKKSREKLARPPLYKPKKAKKPGLMQQMMSGGQGLAR